jgi:tRNA(fMet)-specific endonuclease VapC
MTLVLDTNAYSAFSRGEERVIQLLEEAEELIVPAIVAGELISGFLQGSRWEANWSEFKEFLTQPGIRLHETRLVEAEKYGLLVKQLKEAGTPVPTNDIWIAATALGQGAAVITRDAHFDHFKGMFVIGY